MATGSDLFRGSIRYAIEAIVRGGWLRAMGLLLLAAGVAMAAAGCSSGKSGNETGKYPEIEVGPTGTCVTGGSPRIIQSCAFEFNPSGVAVGGELPQEFTLINTGERELALESVGLEYVPPAGVTEAVPAFRLVLPAEVEAALAGGEGFAIAPKGEGGALGMPEAVTVVVVLTRPGDDGERVATLVVDTDAANAEAGRVRIGLSTSSAFPKLTVNPEWVDFKQVGQGEEREEKVTILNTGTADLVLTGFALVGSEYYTLVLQGVEYPCGGAGSEVTFPGGEEIVIAAGDATYFKVRFVPKEDKPATATLVLFSNDPARAGGTEVKISGNESVPCIIVNPAAVNFGGKPVGETAVNPVEIEACGEAPLEIYAVRIAEGSSPDFAVDASTLDHEPSAESPVVVPMGAKVVLNVEFTPDSENPLVGGVPLLDEGVLVIGNNSFAEETEVPLSGAGYPDICPKAVIKCEQGDEVATQTVLQLSGDESYTGSGTIVKWEWDVDQPAGSQSVFVPSYTFPNPTFEANVTGVYTFYLTVYDEMNTPSCYPETYEVIAMPDEAIHIELLWHTPEDPDETDTGPEAGSDVDLHFAHPWASGPDIDGDGDPDGWFHMPFDCFWFNAHPEWGSYDPQMDDNPGLDRDDTDGAGPENVNLNIPEDVTYTVGVHYWNDHGYGQSYVTVRVYIYAQLAFEQSDVLLQGCDMWSVCTVEWPSGKVSVTTDEAGQMKITPSYKNPYFMEGGC